MRHLPLPAVTPLRTCHIPGLRNESFQRKRDMSQTRGSRTENSHVEYSMLRRNSKIDELSNEEKETANAAAESSEKRTRHTAGPRKPRPPRRRNRRKVRYPARLTRWGGALLHRQCHSSSHSPWHTRQHRPLVLLLGLLITGMLQATKIDLVSSFLLKYMPVFFIPAGVSVIRDTSP